MAFQAVDKSSIFFETDLTPSSFIIHPSGVLHALRFFSAPPGMMAAREEHTFVWITNSLHIESAMTHLERLGFDGSQEMVFIPYSNKQNWLDRYPLAPLMLECTGDGEVVSYLKGDSHGGAEKEGGERHRQRLDDAAAEHRRRREFAFKENKCGVRGCRGHLVTVDFSPCCCPRCERQVHPDCYAVLLERSKSIPHIPGKKFCSAMCALTYKKHHDESNLTWTTDGAGGKDDPKHSEYYLLQWLNNEDNYHRWCSSPETKGVTKRGMAANIGHWIKSQGVRVERDSRRVEGKIGVIEQRMRSAHEIENLEKGAGLEGEALRAMVQAKCEYYYDFKDVFLSRLGMENNQNEDVKLGEPEDGSATKKRKGTTTPDESGSKKLRAEHKKTSRSQRNSIGDEATLVKLMKQTLHQDPGSAVAKLSQNFRTTADSLGSRVMAAKLCAEFEQFLTRKERKQLAARKEEDESSGDSDGAGEGASGASV